MAVLLAIIIVFGLWAMSRALADDNSVARIESNGLSLADVERGWTVSDVTLTEDDQDDVAIRGARQIWAGLVGNPHAWNEHSINDLRVVARHSGTGRRPACTTGHDWCFVFVVEKEEYDENRATFHVFGNGDPGKDPHDFFLANKVEDVPLVLVMPATTFAAAFLNGFGMAELKVHDRLDDYEPD